MQIVRPVVVVAMLTILNACGQPAAPMTPDKHEISEEEAKRSATTLVPGAAAVGAKKEDEKDEHRWLVDVKLASGGAVVVEVDRVGGNVTEINGKKPPFDYDLGAGAGYVRFAEAKGKALAAKPGELEEWELDLVKAVYELEIKAADGKVYEVKLDAKTGAVTSTTEKKAH